ncbi:MAG: hypothetical protein Q8R39_03350 [bacterium]|nr:hypothetical protein [bacterium]MDZ4284636.1 hypothetical protein [Patescibacteria group bacterium]
MLAENFTTRYLTEHDRGALTGFMKRAYGDHYILTDEKFFEWYTHPPRVSDEKSSLPIIGTFWKNALVGHIFVIPHYFSNRTGAKLPMVWNSNFMISAELQQKGIGPAIVRHLLADESIFISAGTGASLQHKGGRSLLEAMGYNFGFMNKYVFVFDEVALKIFKEVRPGDTEKIKEGLSRFQHFKGETVDTMKPSVFDQTMTDFWEKNMAKKFYGAWRDADFFNWRYGAHPHFTYTPLVIADEKHEIRGLAVWRIAEIAPSQKRVGRVVEFLPDDGFAEALAFALLGELQEAGALMADFFMTTNLFDHALTRLGFISSRDFTERVPRLLDPLSFSDPFVNIVSKNIRAIDPENGFNSFSNWYATSADGDQDRPNTITNLNTSP